jgi:hypothetical protein
VTASDVGAGSDSESDILRLNISSGARR